jgi:hypothetical protein
MSVSCGLIIGVMPRYELVPAFSRAACSLGDILPKRQVPEPHPLGTVVGYRRAGCLLTITGANRSPDDPAWRDEFIRLQERGPRGDSAAFGFGEGRLEAACVFVDVVRLVSDFVATGKAISAERQAAA